MPGYSDASSHMQAASSVTGPLEGIPQLGSYWHQSGEFAVSSHAQGRPLSSWTTPVP